MNEYTVLSPFLYPQILECVTVNLTLVYAIFAYVNIKQTNVDTILVRS